MHIKIYLARPDLNAILHSHSCYSTALAIAKMPIGPIVDEIIVVDTGSTDRTKDIAVVFGANVFDFQWTDDFSEARNNLGSVYQELGLIDKAAEFRRSGAQRRTRSGNRG